METLTRHNLLFTGGFDSTFRLCQLSRMEGVEVQPVYLCFSPARFNEKNEFPVSGFLREVNFYE